jgi:hypothetical protein
MPRGHPMKSLSITLQKMKSSPRPQEKSNQLFFLSFILFGILCKSMVHAESYLLLFCGRRRILTVPSTSCAMS